MSSKLHTRGGKCNAIPKDLEMFVTRAILKLGSFVLETSFFFIF